MALKKDKGINPKHRKFADKWIECMSGIEAYESVYGTKGASRNARYVKASQLLRRPEIRKYIDEKLAALDLEYSIEKQEQLAWWRKVRDGIEVAADFKDRLAASEKIGRAIGMFVERTESTVKGQMEVIIRPPKGMEKC